MAKQILFIQGAGEDAHDAWDQKLVDNLTQHLGADYDMRYPRMPNEADPHFANWKEALQAEIAHLKPGAILIGHSLGGTILIHTLAQSPQQKKLAGIVLLAAPYIGAGGWPSDEIKSDAKLGGKLPANTPVHLFHGDKDETAPIAHLGLYHTSVPAAVTHRLHGRDHQLNNDLSEVANVVRALA